MIRKYLALFFLVAAVGQGRLRAQTAGFHDPHIRYTGRIAFTDSAAILAWTATSVKINFSGTGMDALMKDELGENTYNVVVDGQVVSLLHPDNTKKVYTLVSGLANGDHQLELFKRTEWAMGKTAFFGFLPGRFKSRLLSPPAHSKRKLEIFGNSITCGYAVEDTTGQDRGTAPFENGYISYGAILARHYGADYVCTSKSGIGIAISWFPLIMPEMYNRLDAADSNSVWNFSAYQPNLIIVNLFQNDSWLVNMPDNPQFKARFGEKAPTAQYFVDAYAGFIRQLRLQYPKSKILCMLGSMDATRAGSPWPGYVNVAVGALNDPLVYTHFIPFKNTPGHPNAKEQEEMAKDLEQYIDSHIPW